MIGHGSDNNELFISLCNVLSHKVSAQIRKYLKVFNYMELNASFVSVATSDSDNKDNILCLILRWDCKIVKALPRNKKLFLKLFVFSGSFCFQP